MTKWKVKIVVEGVEASTSDEAEELVRNVLQYYKLWNILGLPKVFVVADDEPMDEE